MQRQDREGVSHRQWPRREFLAVTGSAAIAAAAFQEPARGAAAKARYRAAVIGHTGRGDYGHSLDAAWRGIPNVEIVAVADADEKGRAAALKRLGVERGYADYRRMLDEVKPDLVSVAPRWLDQHRDMVVAAAERGVRGIYLEKPMCRTLAEADEMVAVCRKHNVKLAIAHQTRYSPIARVVGDLLRAGAIGQVLELRGRGKEDRRGGGEDLWVLGTHVLDLVHLFGGKPQWCFGSVYENGRPIRREDVKPGAEGIGPLAGDTVHAMYRLDSGATAYFDSVRNAGTGGSRFGLLIFGSTGIIEMTTGHLPPAFILESDPAWSPGRSGKKWIPISSAGIGKPEPLKDGGLPGGNALAVQDLIAAIEEDRPPKADIEPGRMAVEMIAAVFESQRLGKPAAFPLENRENPLTRLE